LSKFNLFMHLLKITLKWTQLQMPNFFPRTCCHRYFKQEPKMSSEFGQILILGSGGELMCVKHRTIWLFSSSQDFAVHQYTNISSFLLRWNQDSSILPWTFRRCSPFSVCFIQDNITTTRKTRGHDITMQRTKNNKFRIYSVEVFHTMYNKAFQEEYKGWRVTNSCRFYTSSSQKYLQLSSIVRCSDLGYLDQSFKPFTTF